MDTRAEAPARQRPFLSAPFVRAMLAGHSAIGIAFAALIYIVCFTGTVLVFLNDLNRWEQPDAPVVTEASPETVATALAAAYAHALTRGAVADVFLTGPRNLSPRLAIRVWSEDGSEDEWFADEQGRLATRIAAPWSEFVARLHTSLHLPRTWGLMLVGLTGVALLSSLISGVLSHPRIFKDAFALRWGGSRLLQEADLHNRLGIWGLPFHVVVSLSGALFGLSTLIIGAVSLVAYEGNSETAVAALFGPMHGVDTNPASVPDLAAMIRTVQSKAPESQFVTARIQAIGTAGQVVHLGMKSPGYLPLANTYYFDGAGNLTGDGGLEQGSIGQRILGALQPLHYGWFGGVPVRLAYGILGLALTVVSFNGVTIWLVRRRDKGRPAPGMERFWCALGWSQPLALALTAAASLAVKGAPLLAVYGTAIAMPLAVAFLTRDVATAARVLRVCGAALLVGLVVMHHVLRPGDDTMALYVNGALLAAAAVIALPVILQCRRLV